MAERKDPFCGYNFVIQIGGLNEAAFQECSGLDSTTSVIEYREGGDKANHVRKLHGLNSYSPITLRRGMTDSEDFWSWRQTVVDGKPERRNGSIVLLDHKFTEVKRWNFTNAWPSKWTGPALNSTGNAIAIETLELAHEELVEA
jgi:phage tail-like protein